MRTFTFQNLLYNKNGTVSGPMSPVIVANEIVKAGFMPTYSGLARIHTKKDGYSDDVVNQRYEGPGKTGLTGHDQLLMVSKTENRDTYGIFIDLGVNYIPVAIWFSDEPVKYAIITPIYKNTLFADRFSDEEIYQIFELAHKKDLTPKQKQTQS